MMSMRHAIVAGATAVLLATALAVPVAAQEQATSDQRICFSNNYAANSWRQAMLRSWDALAQQVVADGTVAAADVRTTAQNDATQQQQQISDMILEGCNAIVVNAANPESLNSVVEEACAQGIPVVSFDGIVTADCAYRVGVDFVDMGYQQLVYLADKLPEGGKLLEIRGRQREAVRLRQLVEHGRVLSGRQRRVPCPVLCPGRGRWTATP
jgi:ribose transport system substrate-binding protein